MVLILMINGIIDNNINDNCINNINNIMVLIILMINGININDNCINNSKIYSNTIRHMNKII